MYSLTSGTSIHRDADGASIPPDPANSDYQAFLAWKAQGNTPTPYVPPLPALTDYEDAVQAHLDAYAIAHGYRNADVLVSFKDSANTAWAAQGTAMLHWRDATWAAAYTMLQAFNSGQIPQPTLAAFTAALPPGP